MDQLLPSLKRKSESLSSSSSSTFQRPKRLRVTPRPVTPPGRTAGNGSSPILTPLPIDPSVLAIPPIVPFINRLSLKELDLASILRSPQLRHDLLFDPNLQFRPTSSPRKRDIAEAYWRAVERELDTDGCTCISFTANLLHLSGSISVGHKLPTPRCACKQLPPSIQHPLLAYNPAQSILTCRSPSRIRPLLDECRHVLLMVIQPIPPPDPSASQHPAASPQHAAQAAYIRSMFDPALILSSPLSAFDPSGLLTAIANILKSHCAPMRDHLILNLIAAADNLRSNGTSASAAVRALRLCMEILELMKLDIANHQLASLRPSLIRSAPQYESKIFSRKFAQTHDPLQHTRKWLQDAHALMLTHDKPLPNPLLRSTTPPASSSSHSPLSIPRANVPSPTTLSDDDDDDDDFPANNETASILHSQQRSLLYKNMRKNQQIFISTVCAIVDLAFSPPSTLPETLFLDASRLAQIANEADEVHSAYMLGLLYRQLVSTSPSPSPSPSPVIPPTPFLGGSPPAGLSKVTEQEMKWMHKQIKDIAGSRLGRCVLPSTSATGPDGERERAKSVREDVVLQIARRVTERRDVGGGFSSPVVSWAMPSPRFQQHLSMNASSSSSSSSSTTSTPSTSPTSSIFSIPPTPQTPFTPLTPFSPSSSCIPDSRTTRLAQTWAETHMSKDSVLAKLTRKRLRDVVFEGVVERVAGLGMISSSSSSAAAAAVSLANLPSSSSSCTTTAPSSSTTITTTPPTDKSIGMESLTEELKNIIERLTKLVEIHMNTYLVVYERENGVCR